MHKSIVSFLLLVCALSSCHYYRFKQGNNATYEKTVAGIERKFSYVIVHCGGDVFRIKHPDYNRNGITGVKDTIPKSVNAIYNRALGKRNLLINRRELKYDAMWEDQLHLFVKKYDTLSDTIKIQNIDVTKMEYLKKNKGLSAFASTVTAFTVGFVAPVALLFASCACPHAYVQEGDQWVFSNTLFTGATNPKIERVDIKQMPDNQPNNSTFPFQLRNEENEVQYINQLELVEVVHPEGISVIPSQQGNFYPIKSLIPPSEAKDSHGNIFTYEVQQSDLIAYDFKSTEDDGLAYLYTTFQRESTSDNQVLILTAKNTGWSGYLYQEFTRLFGSNYQKWVQHNARLSKHKIESRIHDAGLKLEVEVWLNNEWLTMDQVELAGNVKNHQVALNIPEEALKNQTLKFRLRSGFNFWEVDQIALGMLSDQAIVSKIHTPQLTQSNGESNLRIDDVAYLELLPGGQPILLQFEGLSTQSQRSLFLKSKGYYRPLTNYEGKTDVRSLRMIKKHGLSLFSKEKYDQLQQLKEVFSNENK
jgi:hypothetical protein